MTDPRFSVQSIPIDAITIPADHRPIDPTAIPGLVESIAKVGLRTPISVRLLSEAPCKVVLVAGRHRLAAHQALGLAHIECVFVNDPLLARLVTRTENLHRADLTAQQKAEELAAWIEDLKKIPGQVDHVIPLGGRGQRGGMAEVARQAGIDRTEARRATAIASISPEAKSTAAELGLADNQSALLEISRAEGRDAQVQKAHELAERTKKKPGLTIEQEFNALLKVWQRCRPAVHRKFITDVLKIARGKKRGPDKRSGTDNQKPKVSPVETA